MPLNYTNSIPLHLQLKEKIVEKIYNGQYVGKIPSERELMDEYYVSRSTVRQSVEQLVRDGILIRKPGKGTFIKSKPINDWLGNLSSTSEVIENMGMIPGTKLVKAEIIHLSGTIREITGLEKAYHFKRVRYANNIPIGIERHYYPILLGEKLMEFDLNKEAFYDLLERALNVRAFQASQVIKAANSTREDAKLLNIPESTSVLIAERKITDINGSFIEFEEAYYRSDMYAFNIELARKSH
jgi:GntR family transcriptional regulator